MNIFGVSLRELVRRRRGFALSVALVVCVTGVYTSVATLRDATAERIRRVTAQMGNNLIFLPEAASLDAYHTASPDQETMPESLGRLLQRHPKTGFHGTHYVMKLQRRVRLAGAEVIATGFEVIAGGHRPGEDTARRRSFLDDPLPAGEAILGSEAARLMGLSAGDSFEIAGRTFRVSQARGEAGDFEDLRVWVNLAEAQDAWGQEGVITSVDALGCFGGGGGYLRPISEALKTDPALAGLRLMHTDVPARTRQRARVAVTTVGRLSGGIVTLLAALGISAFSLMEVRDRRQEIGVLAAMGAGSAQVLMLFAPKLVATGAIGGLLGWMAGTVAAVHVGPRLDLGLDELVFRALPGLLPASVATGLAFMLLASGFALWRAARLDPAVALREE